MMSDVLEFTTNLALKAGSLLLKYYEPSGIHASQKPDHTLVTAADLAADELISHAIHDSYPQDEIISEESTHTQANRASSVWIIDPLDGTTNFSLGLSIWGVSIARITDGYPTIGVLYFPMIRELYTCKRGSGSYLNHSPLTLTQPASKQSISVFACCSRTFRKYNISIPYKPRIFGSGSYTFCLVARGSAALGFDAEPKIWDLAAAWLLVEEAGGKISAYEENPAFPVANGNDYADLNFPTLAASTPEIFQFGQSRIQRKSKFALTVLKKD